MTRRVFIQRGTCHVDISMAGEAARLSGQDLGGFAGADEYEYWITIQSEDFPVIRSALGAGPDDDVIEVLCANAEMIFTKGERTWLRAIGIEPGFSNYF